jgi:small subunit ribosomal protein S13
MGGEYGVLTMAEKIEKAVPTEQKEEKQEKKIAKPVQKEAPKPAEKKLTARRIVRLMATDVDGDLPVERALREIKGVSFMFSRAVCLSTGIDGKKKVAELNEQEMKTLEGFIRNPNLPAWLLNRRKDTETGKDRHTTMSELDLQKREDINLMKRIRSYKGVRHEFGLPVRGQRTRTSFRTQKTVGVARKKVQAAARAAATGGKKEEKK